ncbi:MULTISPECIES: ABC transporter permease [unclassified Marinobacter]|uniref:ABC transporter permease n=1 Tax=unclassified Marinobacter TaxID=83889 RepID=UPI002010267F|nr:MULTISPECIES: ABC transporter permease [unclassified Marinobacter]UQG57803.1 ABC transporter permease [Marinobacter sp. M4C]UQG66608.1 ABC transporter permease [Marinobacter sp. M2C]UQG70888.1 ABC transporter permease [Marinobacter sp. M1C]
MNSYALWTAFYTILSREIRRFTRIWPQTLLPPAVTMTLYFIIFGNLIGSRIGKMDGFDYMQFITPGLIMMAVITSSYANVVSSFFSMKFQHSIEELLVSPVPNWIILAGYVFGGMARGLGIGVIVTLVSLAFTHLQIHNLLMVVVTVFLTSALFSLGGFINAMLATKFDDISIVPTFILTPLTYLGGVFYSINLLPDVWRAVSMANPILYMVNGFRYGILGVSDVNPFVSLGMILLFIVVLAAVALNLLRRGKGIRN